MKTGRYRHYKGNEYTVLGVARHSETEEELVVYRQEYGDHGLWVRPKQMFCETVEVEGRRVPRFQFIGAGLTLVPNLAAPAVSSLQPNIPRREVRHATRPERRTAIFFEPMSKRRKGFPSETQVKRGVRIVHGDKLLEEKLGRNDPCPCGSGLRFKRCCLGGGRF